MIFGDGKQTRDFVSVHDVVDVVVKCIECDDAIGEVFNVGTGVATTVNELAGLCSGMEPEYREAQSGDIRESYANVGKLRELVGWVPAQSLENGLKELL